MKIFFIAVAIIGAISLLVSFGLVTYAVVTATHNWHIDMSMEDRKFCVEILNFPTFTMAIGMLLADITNTRLKKLIA